MVGKSNFNSTLCNFDINFDTTEYSVFSQGFFKFGGSFCDIFGAVMEINGLSFAVYIA